MLVRKGQLLFMRAHGLIRTAVDARAFFNRKLMVRRRTRGAGGRAAYDAARFTSLSAFEELRDVDWTSTSLTTSRNARNAGGTARCPG